MSKRDRASSSEDPTSIKGRGAWTTEEDDKLIEVIRELGFDSWRRIASRMPGRSYRSCRTRWFSYLRHHVTENAGTISVIELYDSYINDSKTPKEVKEYYGLLKIDYLDKKRRESDYSFHIMGCPLVEITKLSIDLHRFGLKFDQPFGIYGHIILIDELDNEFLIFKRDQTNPLTLDSHSVSTQKRLVLENFDFRSPRCLPGFFRVLFNLRDINRNKFFINESMKVAFDAPNLPCDDKMTFFLDHHCSIEGNIYRSAVVACVGVSVVKGDDNVDDETEVNVGGSVVGAIQVTNSRVISHELFSNRSGNPLIMKYGGDLVNSGAIAVAVPSHSSLAIQLDLTVGGFKISDSVDFKANDRGWINDKVIEAGKLCNVVITVKWLHPVHSLPEIELRQWCVERGPSKNATASTSLSSVRARAHAVDTSKNNNIHFLSRSTRQSHSEPVYIQPHLRELESRNWLVRCGRGELRESLVEIFCICIYIFPEDFQIEHPSIHGRITGDMVSGQNSVDYFKLEEIEYDFMHYGVLYPHGPKRCHLSSRFAMTLDLKDGEDREISYGYFTWNELQDESWMNRRLCSVVPGKHGYAAVHYMVIKDALQAKLKFTLSSNDNSVGVGGCYIRGLIRARYSNYRYVTDYDDSYYTSTLFKNYYGYQHLGNDGEVPLLRSAVAVPIITNLIVSVSIQLKPSDADTAVWRMEGEATLEPKMEKDSRGKTVYLPDKKLVSTVGNYCFEAYVEWAGAR